MNFSEEQICYLEDFFGNTCHYPDSYQKGRNCPPFKYNNGPDYGLVPE
uniref:Uncharacterized protein n=1 Tax=Meloidogyne enterolobii TaxID=390850 RepID=A0A6V7XVL3_MELEN|nr:unnamed protein product [Meloidogyne enterolobii]